jgi:hypothetical protein
VVAACAGASLPMVLERLAAVETAQDEVVAHFLAIIGKARLGTSALCVAARHRCKRRDLRWRFLYPI